MKVASAIAALCVLAACAPEKLVPDDYAGPVAHVTDTVAQAGPVSANLFYLAAVNGRAPADAGRFVTHPNFLSARSPPTGISRDIRAEPATVTIAANQVYIAPGYSLLGAFRSVLPVQGDVTFTPAPNHTYRVVGVIRQNYSAVWIVDETTGERISEKFEASAPAAAEGGEKERAPNDNSAHE